MKLDKRIFPAKRPLTCFDSEYANQFIGKKGFFADELKDFVDLDKVLKTELKNIYQNDEDCFVSPVTGYKYFLPFEWVNMREPEKKYRPFSIEDWKLKHSIGEAILYRYKGTYCGDHSEAELAYLGFIKPLDGITDEAGKGQIVLGNNAHGLQNLFEDYEIEVNGEWKPFGVEIEE